MKPFMFGRSSPEPGEWLPDGFRLPELNRVFASDIVNYTLALPLVPSGT